MCFICVSRKLWASYPVATQTAMALDDRQVYKKPQTLCVFRTYPPIPFMSNEIVEQTDEVDISQNNKAEDSQLDFNFLDGSSKTMDEEALEMMKKNHDEYGKVSWTCQSCDFACNDKTRTKRHIRNNHLKRQKIEVDDYNETATNNISIPEETLNESDIKSNFAEEDIQALDMMSKKKNEFGGSIWECSACEMSHFDKTRVRKHVIRKHIKSAQS